jgi:sugar-specific transcriptional regulator TrmB
MPLVMKLSRDLADAETVVQGLAMAYESSKFVRREGPKEAEEFWQLEGRPGVINKLNQIFSEASKSINYCTTASGLVRAYKAHSEVLEKARERGTDVRVLSPLNSENSGVAREMSEVLTFKILDEPFGENFVTVDALQLVVVETKPEDVRTDQGVDKAIWTTNRLLVDLHEQLFERIWISLPMAKFPAR